MRLHFYHITGGHSSLYGRDVGSPYAVASEPIVVTVRSVKDAERIMRAMAVLAPEHADVRALVETAELDELGRPWCHYYYVTAEHVSRSWSRSGVDYACGVHNG